MSELYSRKMSTRGKKRHSERVSRGKNVAAAIVFVALSFIGWLLLTSGVWIKRQFGKVSWWQAKAYLPGQQTLEHTPSVFISKYAWQSIFTAACLTLVSAAVVAVIVLLSRRTSKKRLAKILVSLLAVTPVLLGTGAFTAVVDVWGAMTNKNKMAEFYASPKILDTPTNKMNLVVIYLESMDDAFGNADLVGENTLASLQEATKDWKTIDRFSYYPTGGWTMPGIVSTQCALPKRPTDSDSMFGQAKCLGDVLHDAGYKNVWMGAADKEFEQKGIFLQSHHFDAILDRQYWESHGEEPPPDNYWGLTDARLFEKAKGVISKLEANNEPYSLQMITVDNHEPVRQTEDCPTTSENKTFSVLRCQSDTVADFINYMKDQGILDHTVVVVMADHSVHDNDLASVAYQKELSPDDQENIPLFFRVYSPNEFSFGRQKDNQMHMFPTMLELLGFKLTDHRAGLGVSLLTPESDPSVEGTIVGLSHDELASVFSGTVPPELRSPGEATY